VKLRLEIWNWEFRTRKWTEVAKEST
jgi:hypothetical protein